MNTDLVSHWNNSTINISKEKEHSGYAVQVEAQIERGSTVCDVGAGSGSDSMYFLARGHSVIALDISDVGLTMLREKATEKNLDEKLVIKQVDFNDLRLPLDDASIDVVYSRLALHYFTLNETAELFKEIKRVIKPGGKAFIVVKSRVDGKEFSFLTTTAKEVEEGVFLDSDKTKKSRYSNKQWKMILETAGIAEYNIGTYTENFQGKNDMTKSGNKELLLTEITFTNE